MKKTVFSMLALSALVFACKKDKDDNNGLSEQALLGKWEMKVQYRNVVTNNIGKRDTLVIPEGPLAA
jgi:nitrous oxide reductase accessory protein NosL